MKKMQNIFMCHYSVENWLVPARWTEYFTAVQRVLGERVSHLDVHDPVRRVVVSLESAASYICDPEFKTETRWIFGEVRSTGARFTIHYPKSPGKWGNALSWSLPQTATPHAIGWSQIKGLFEVGSELLGAYYGFCEDVAYLRRFDKRKHGPVDIERELPGVFRINYFGPAYVSFFGREKFCALKSGQTENGHGGIILEIGATPLTSTQAGRDRVREILGEESFAKLVADPSKPKGKYVLTTAQLIGQHKP